jgi:hypothetical protein
VSKKSSVQTKVVSTSGVGVCSSSRLKEQVANVAEDANMNPQDANMNPVCGEEKTNMNPERGNTASCASPEALPKFEAAANVADLPHPNDASEHDAQSTQPKDTINETQRNGRVPKHGSAKHGELLHHISHFLFTLKFTLSSPQPSSNPNSTCRGSCRCTGHGRRRSIWRYGSWTGRRWCWTHHGSWRYGRRSCWRHESH